MDVVMNVMQKRINM